MTPHLKIESTIRRVANDGHIEADLPESSCNERDIVVRVFERPYRLRIAGVSNQQRVSSRPGEGTVGLHPCKDSKRK